jgi:hypothetical protein
MAPCRWRCPPHSRLPIVMGSFGGLLVILLLALDRFRRHLFQLRSPKWLLLVGLLFLDRFRRLVLLGSIRLCVWSFLPSSYS